MNRILPQQSWGRDLLGWQAIRYPPTCAWHPPGIPHLAYTLSSRWRGGNCRPYPSRMLPAVSGHGWWSRPWSRDHGHPEWVRGPRQQWNTACTHWRHKLTCMRCKQSWVRNGRVDGPGGWVEWVDGRSECVNQRWNGRYEWRWQHRDLPGCWRHKRTCRRHVSDTMRTRWAGTRTFQAFKSTWIRLQMQQRTLEHPERDWSCQTYLVKMQNVLQTSLMALGGVPGIANDTETAGDDMKSVRTRQTNEKAWNLVPIEAAEQHSDGLNGVGDCTDGLRECMATQSIAGDVRTTWNEAEHSPMHSRWSDPTVQWRRVSASDANLYVPTNAPNKVLNATGRIIVFGRVESGNATILCS